ncbi:MAG: hypothetical protein QOF76_2956 [Solirubrobacteraceae bacterium]|jgi:hypothetical protein|nr:hypothetical protein [Solirubrobacteraceae bacterium]
MKVVLRTLPLLVLVLWAAACGGAEAAPRCDLVAGPGDGAQRLANRLQPGQIGCLHAGNYGSGTADYALRLNHGGREGAPITLRSFPGERATFTGPVSIPPGSNDVTLQNLNIADTSRSAQITVQINARRARLIGDDITNGSRKTCVALGGGRAGRARDTTIADSVLHDCGSTAHDLYDHAIYVAHADNTVIRDNLIRNTAAYGVHLYPDAQNSRVSGNVLVGNGGGVIFAGEGDSASSGNLVTQNVIADTRRAAGIVSYWSGRVGSGNVARDNCLTAAAPSGKGFSVAGDVVADPHFADAADGDYKIAADGACASTVGGVLARAAVALHSALRR